MKLLALIAMVLSIAVVCLFPSSGESHQRIGDDAFWLKEYQGDRLYIKTDCLEITDKSILVRDEDNLPIKLNHIAVDALGFFTTLDALISSDPTTRISFGAGLVKHIEASISGEIA